MRPKGIYIESFGEDEPIVVLVGKLMPIAAMAQVTGPLSRRRQIIAIDLEGHGHRALQTRP
ncbi:alpha/beta fold hydrolase [Mesorhizobium sp. L-2-11]|uniref:alpha/beta fold hydrolase n=1 Tax=Mesorhizobium sp. L-2-11 TaxID=2744521 RepID=UPI001928EBBD|nr:hypothetical protein [Mesorhizobium sp. L-2-11]BCH19597.1 hypothetical protein MesoLjLa_64480 [Mesorhizobium sp. L-2-11]